jgi:hypothetical protein
MPEAVSPDDGSEIAVETIVSLLVQTNTCWQQVRYHIAGAKRLKPSSS